MGEERNELRRSRNLSIANAKGVAKSTGNTGQMLDFLNTSAGSLYGMYGDAYNKSLRGEKEYNTTQNAKQQAINAEIGMKEIDANTAERDAARSIRMQALSNIGTTTAMAAIFINPSGG